MRRMRPALSRVVGDRVPVHSAEYHRTQFLCPQYSLLLRTRTLVFTRQLLSSLPIGGRAVAFAARELFTCGRLLPSLARALAANWGQRLRTCLGTVGWVGLRPPRVTWGSKKQTESCWSPRNWRCFILIG